MSKKRGRTAKTLEGKLMDLDEVFVSEIRLSTKDGVKDRLIKLDKYETELESAKKDDLDLASKREALAVANQTYSEPLKAIKLKRSFALQVLSEKGG